MSNDNTPENLKTNIYNLISSFEDEVETLEDYANKVTLTQYYNLCYADVCEYLDELAFIVSYTSKKFKAWLRKTEQKLEDKDIDDNNKNKDKLVSELVEAEKLNFMYSINV